MPRVCAEGVVGIFGRTIRILGCLYRIWVARDAVWRSVARRSSSIGLSDGDGEDEGGELAGGESLVAPSSSLLLEPLSSDDESAFSQPAFACSNRSLVSVTVETLTHSSPPWVTISTKAHCFLGRPARLELRVGGVAQ